MSGLSSSELYGSTEAHLAHCLPGMMVNISPGKALWLELGQPSLQQVTEGLTTQAIASE